VFIVGISGSFLRLIFETPMFPKKGTPSEFSTASAGNSHIARMKSFSRSPEVRDETAAGKKVQNHEGRKPRQSQGNRGGLVIYSFAENSALERSSTVSGSLFVPAEIRDWKFNRVRQQELEPLLNKIAHMISEPSRDLSLSPDSRENASEVNKWISVLRFIARVMAMNEIARTPLPPPVFTIPQEATHISALRHSEERLESIGFPDDACLLGNVGFREADLSVPIRMSQSGLLSGSRPHGRHRAHPLPRKPRSVLSVLTMPDGVWFQ
jgi:hypothetical protein